MKAPKSEREAAVEGQLDHVVRNQKNCRRRSSRQQQLGPGAARRPDADRRDPHPPRPGHRPGDHVLLRHHVRKGGQEGLRLPHSEAIKFIIREKNIVLFFLNVERQQSLPGYLLCSHWLSRHSYSATAEGWSSVDND